MRKTITTLALLLSFACRALAGNMGLSGAITVSSQFTITHCYLCFFQYEFNPGPGSPYDYDLEQNVYLGSFAAGVNAITNSMPADPATQYTLMAVYTDGTHTGLAVAMNNASASSAVGLDFATVFGFSDSYETNFITSISATNTAGLESFVFDQVYSKDLLANYGTVENELVGFSNGQIIGSITTNPGVPNPTITMPSASSISISWANVGNYALQQSTNLSTWTTSTNSIVTLGNTSSVTLQPAPGNLFFRLVYP